MKKFSLPLLNPRQKPNQSEAGQSLVEFALVLLFIIIPFTFAFVEAGVMLYKYVTLTNSAREAARAGSIYLYIGDPGNSASAPDAGRSGSAANAINTTLTPLVPAVPDCSGTAATTSCNISYSVSSSPYFDPLRSTDTMTVTVTNHHQFLFGALGSSMDLKAQASMHIEPSAVISNTVP